jgi:TRAP-type C4-dicarboxylate transport system permease small subunit
VGTFSAGEEERRLIGRWSRKKEDWMKRAIFLATLCCVAMLIFASVAFAQETTPMETTPMETIPAGELASASSLAVLWPAAALLLGSGILTYAILRRR